MKAKPTQVSAIGLQRGRTRYALRQFIRAGEKYYDARKALTAFDRRYSGPHLAAFREQRRKMLWETYEAAELFLLGAIDEHRANEEKLRAESRKLKAGAR
jgi:hypothetical protein